MPTKETKVDMERRIKVRKSDKERGRQREWNLGRTHTDRQRDCKKRQTRTGNETRQRLKKLRQKSHCVSASRSGVHPPLASQGQIMPARMGFMIDQKKSCCKTSETGNTFPFKTPDSTTWKQGKEEQERKKLWVCRKVGLDNFNITEQT